jgi:3-methyladenine DNA glycosylase/8-oxoguanine DNA glycosylase
VTEQTRLWRAGRAVDVQATLGPLRRGGFDPAYRVDPRGRVWWATDTPVGPGTVCIDGTRRSEEIRAVAWGDGSQWLLASLPRLLGADDDVSGFQPHHRVVAEAWRRSGGWRVPATGRVFDALAAAIIEQKVTGGEARHAWQVLVRRYGVPAPGPSGQPEGMPPGMYVPPPPAVWAAIPVWEWRRAGVTPQRSDALVRCARIGSSLERAAAPIASAERALRSVTGVGVWTAAEVRQRAHGDADAVSFGDIHVAKNLCWWLTGERGDDDAMRELLAPYAGHRYRVQRLMELSGAQAPRRGPRFAPPAHRPIGRAG